jgi:hypothetical protein
VSTHNLKRWIRRLEDAARSIDNDGTPSQVGLSAEECRSLAMTLGVLVQREQVRDQDAQLRSSENRHRP